VKPKSNRKSGPLDNCQTPPYALMPIYPHIDTHYVWECAAGKRSIVRQLRKVGIPVIDTDKNDPAGNGDFFEISPKTPDYTIITNPPYSIKYDWLARCYELDHPFALLLPVETIGSSKAQKMFDKYGMQIILMSPRVDFYMPEKGWDTAGAQFPTAWFTWKMNLPSDINYARINKPKRNELEEYWKEAFGQ